MRQSLCLAIATVLIPLSGFAAAKAHVHKRVAPKHAQEATDNDTYIDGEPDDGGPRCTFGRVTVNCNSKLGEKLHKEANARKPKGCSNDEAIDENFSRTAGAAISSSVRMSNEGTLSEAATQVIIGAGYPSEFYREYIDMYNGTTYYISSQYICHIRRVCRPADIYEPSSGCEAGAPVRYDVTCAAKLKNRVCPKTY